MTLASRRWLGAALAAALLVPASSAIAAPSWRAPFAVSPPGQEADEPALAFDRQGNALVIWRQQAPTHGIHAAMLPAGGGLAVPEIVSTVGGAPQIGFDARGEAIAAWHRRSEGPGGCSLCVEAAFRSPGGVFGLPQRVPIAGANPELAVDPRGNALLLARHPGGVGKPIKASFRPSGGRFGAEQKLGGGQTGDPEVAFDARGRAVAVWSRGVRVLSAFRGRRGAFGKPRTIAAMEGVGSLHLAFGSAGKALAVWEDQELDGGLFPTGSRIRAAASRR